jgi:hypothetical protein
MQVSNDAAKEFDKSVLAVMMKVTPLGVTVTHDRDLQMKFRPSTK